MKSLVLILILATLQSMVQAQEIPNVSFNHLFFVLGNKDLKAIQQADFIKNKLAAFETRTTKVSDETWTGTYLYSNDNYIEFFDTNGVEDAPIGSLGIGFSVDRLSDLYILQAALSKEYTVKKFERSKDYNGNKIRWFHSLGIMDSAFYEQSFLIFWVMAYDTAYFNYNKFKYKNDVLTERNYLRKFDEERNGKMIRSFNGAILNLTQYEKDYFSKYLQNIGFKQGGSANFVSADGHFTFTLNSRAPESNIVLSALLFETNYANEEQSVKISDNVNIMLMKDRGQITFR